VTSTPVLLVVSACATAVIHALIPDHWLPFAILARTERWSERRLVAIVGLTGVLHVTVSLTLGALLAFAGSAAGRVAARRAGASLEPLAGGLLALFGIVYGLWAHRREARAHADGTHAHGHGALASLHAHGHLLSRLSGRSASAGALVAIIGISPCVLLQPILFASAAEGWGTAAAAAAGFALCTIATMLLVAILARRGLERLDLGFFTRFGDLLSGLVIAAIGVVVLWQGLR
jgi:nickel/cobalt transporter (NicO) family protein